MKKKLIFLLSTLSLMPLGALSQTVTARAYYYDKTEMKTVETTSYFIQETGNDDLLVITFFSEPVGVIS